MDAPLSPQKQAPAGQGYKIDWRALPLGTLAIAFAAWGLSNMDQSLFGYAVPGLMGTFKIGLGAISLILSASFAFGIAVSIAVGVLTDTWGARTTLPLCLGLSAVLVGLQAFAPNALVFGCLRVAGASAPPWRRSPTPWWRVARRRGCGRCWSPSCSAPTPWDGSSPRCSWRRSSPTPVGDRRFW